ncbi:hypothetical protein ABIC28_005432 [Rhodococcus sp. PvR044]|jgi:hypothetical protein|nr:hypothetical protein [Rhodococcus sp. PvR099]PTR36633.1 hypothetical protein C8K38_12326 [Rhodococcus sp. OK611]SNX93727.1 hypothetical protein SAMN05447004_12326 [Rhodococcus sp. OK270]
MTGDDELLQVEQVIARLTARYPSISPIDIEHTVRTIHQRFADGKVRDFVPLLVEKAARRDIAGWVTTQPRTPTALSRPATEAGGTDAPAALGQRRQRRAARWPGFLAAWPSR